MHSLKQMWTTLVIGCVLTIAAPLASASGRDHRGGHEDRSHSRSGYEESGHRRQGRNDYDRGPS